MILPALCWIAAAAFALVGIVALADPLRMSHFYGIPVSDDPGYGFVRATGTRDLVIGVILGAALAYGYWPLVEVVLGGGLFLAAGDFWIAYHAAGKRFHRGHAVHGVGIVALLLVLAMALFAVGR